MILRKWAMAAALAGGSAAMAVDFTITPLVVEGDIVPGVGGITSISNIAVNNNGEWVVEADTDNADTNTDTVVLRSGALWFREGQLVDPNGDPNDPNELTIDTFDAINLSESGAYAWNIFLDNVGLTLPTNVDSGILYNGKLVYQEGDRLNIPNLGPNTPFTGWFETYVNNDGDFVMVSSMDDPLIATTTDRVLIYVTPDPNGRLNPSVISKEGDVPVGFEPNRAVADFETSPHESWLNDNGLLIYGIDAAGSTANDNAIALGGVLLAREGQPSLVPGRTWGSIASSEVYVNNYGTAAMSTDLGESTTDDAIIIKSDGTIVAQEGSTKPSISPFTFTSFGSGPTLIADTGRVFHYGDWNDTDTSIDTGYFVDDELLVQEGTTFLPFPGGGGDVATLRGVESGYAISDNGKYMIFEAVTLGGIEGAWLIEFMPECPDFDDSGAVDLADLAGLLAAFGSDSTQPGYDPRIDIDFSGQIDLADLAGVLSQFGNICP